MGEIGTKMVDTLLFLPNLYRFDPYQASMGEIGIKTTDTILFVPNLYRFDPYLAGMGEIGTKTNACMILYYLFTIYYGLTHT